MQVNKTALYISGVVVLIAIHFVLMRPAYAVTVPQTGGTTIDDAANGWVWSGMTQVDDPQFHGGSAHAGGAGSYGAYTFAGTGVTVYGMRGASINVDGKTHKIGRMLVFLDNKLEDTVNLSAGDTTYEYPCFTISGCSEGNHVLQIRPEAGWVAVDYITVQTNSTASAPNASKASADAHLVAYWPLDDGKGFGAADASGGGHSGTLQGAWWTADGRSGKPAVALSGNGSVEVAEPVVDTSNSFTVCAWVRLANLSGYQTFVSMDGDTVSGFYLQLSNDVGKFTFTRLPTDSNAHAEQVCAAANFAPQPGVWYFLTGVYDRPKNVIALFVDGQLQSWKPFTTPWRAGGHTAIGRAKYDSQPVDFVNGAINDVRIYDTALSPTAIAQLYEASK
jgi:hypothetical protein